MILNIFIDIFEQIHKFKIDEKFKKHEPKFLSDTKDLEECPRVMDCRFLAIFKSIVI